MNVIRRTKILIKCTKCGKEFDLWDEQLNASFTKIPTYGSKYDGETISISLCTDCFDKVVDYIHNKQTEEQ